MSTLPPAGTVCCLLCRGVVAYRNLDMNRFLEHIIIILINIILLRFQEHMNHEHGAFFDMDFLLAASFMDDKKRKVVRNIAIRWNLSTKLSRRRKRKEVGEKRGEKRPAASPMVNPPPVPALQV